MYELIREDIVIKLGARFGEGGGEGEGEGEGDGEGIDGGDAAGHGGSGDLGGYGVGVGVGERDGREGCKGGCNSGEKGFRSSVKEVRSFFFLFPSFLSVVARVFGAIGKESVVFGLVVVLLVGGTRAVSLSSATCMCQVTCPYTGHLVDIFRVTGLTLIN